MPLIVDAESGVNDYLDRDGSRGPVQFHIPNDHDKHPIDGPGGAGRDQVEADRARAVRDAGRARASSPTCGPCARTTSSITTTAPTWTSGTGSWPSPASSAPWTSCGRPWSGSGRSSRGRRTTRRSSFPPSKTRYASLPEKISFIHAEDILERYPYLPRKARETAILQESPAVFIYGIGWTLEDGYPHEMRAADYDDWATETRSRDGRPMHGLNGDILVWNPVTRRRHELSSMGVRVDAEALRRQLELTGQLELLKYPYHQGIVRGELPLSIGGGIGQSRTVMSLLKKAHLGEVSATVWPAVLKEMCRKRNIHVIE